MKSSRLKGFYKLRRGERLDLLRDFANLPSDQTRVLGQDGALPFEVADLFVENAVGSFPLPLGVATGFKVNGVDRVVPMAVEESSVIAAASNAAKWVYESGGFESTISEPLMIGQIQLLDIPNFRFLEVEALLQSYKADLLQLANETHPRLLMRGGGAKDLEIRLFPDAEIPFIVVHILLDTRDAMGANLVNTVCEKLGPKIEKITGGRVGLKILSNLADRKVFKTVCFVKPEFLELKEPTGAPLEKNARGDAIAQRIVEAFVFADNDPYRAATHNKGIMNGIDPVVIATGNDWRAVEAGAHAYAARTGRYRSLSHWTVENGRLRGDIEIPLQLGTVGGVTRLHPLAKISLHLLGNPGADQLGQIISCAGLASNLAALRALTTTGIQRGHMKLHAKNLAMAAGCRGEEVDLIANQMVLQKTVSATAAEEGLAAHRSHKARGKSDDAFFTQV